MEKFLELVGSRKFWSAVFAAGLAVWGFIAGEVTAEVALAAVVVVIGLWQQAQSRVDANKQ